MTEFTLSTTADPAAEALLLREILAFNAGLVGESGNTPLTVLTHDPVSGAVRGGIAGRLRYRWLFVETFYLPPDLRGSGLGTRMLAAAEAEAASRGCIGAYLDTNVFQAPGFYEKQGYSLFGALEDYPMPGYTKFYYRKLFAA